MTRVSRWKGWVGAVAAAGLLGGCHSVPLHGNPAVQGSAAQAPLEFFEVDWWTRLVEPTLLEYAPRERATPAYDASTGYVITLTRDGFVRAISTGERPGKVVWSFKTSSRFTAGALVHEGLVFVPGTDGFLYALDARSGELKWKYAANESLATTPVLSDGLLLVVSESDTLFAVNAQSGQWAWQYRRDLPSGFTIHGACTPVSKDGVVYQGFSDGYLVALDMRDGAMKWEKGLASGGTQFLDVDTSPVLDADGHLYVASYHGGLFALDSANGDILWSTAVLGLTSLVGRGPLLYGAGDARVDAYLKETGRLVWSLDLGERAASKPVWAQGMLLVANQRALLFVDPATGRIRVTWNPGEGVTASPRVEGSRVYVLSNNGFLYALRVKGGRG
ncbi:PQQ-binding-like beta-propeller repeat protein [Myxococcaceae bacterium GXIMD 01537]